MTYDLLIKNGRIIDGSGAPAFLGDVGVQSGKIVAIGKLRGAAVRTIDADGLVVSPGIIDNHCHYDAQVIWDPLCSYSCYHGATTVIIGNCSLALAPVRPGAAERLSEYLSYVEVIPMEALRTVKVTWETIAQYMAVIDKNLGVNVGSLIGHTAVREYVMGNESQGRAATAQEIDAMCGVVRDGMKAGALGLSVSKQIGHYDPQGERIPALWAEEDELFALGNVLGELGTGVIQSGGGAEAEAHNRLMSRLSEATGRQVIYNSLNYSVRRPEAWKAQLKRIDENVKAGIRANPMCSPNISTHHFTMRNAQSFRGVTTWHPILLASDEEKLKAYKDPEVRKKLHREVIEWAVDMPEQRLAQNWPEKMWVEKTVLEKNKNLEGKSLQELAEFRGQGVIDAFLDLAVEENLDTEFSQAVSNSDSGVMAQLLNYPNAYIGLSDSGAHVQFKGGYGFSSRLLGYWVRQEKIMTLEQAVKRLTFDSASVFGLYDRGMLRPGLAADIMIFNPDTIRSLPQEPTYDYPGGAWRMKELPIGVHYTIVNGQVLIENGRPTGALPGRLLKNSLYQTGTNE